MSLSKWLLALCTALFLNQAYAVIDSYEFLTNEQEQRFFDLTNELRCPKCQNQSIGDSNAPIAQDLRREVHSMIIEGADDKAIIDFMLDRYGDFVLYTPRFEGKNLILWLGPLVLLFIGFLVLLMVVRNHRASSVKSAAEKTTLAEGHATTSELTAQQRKKLDKLLGGKQ